MTAPIASFAAIGGLGTTELIIILVIVLIFFGGAKLPGLAKGFGQSVKEFKKATKDDDVPVVEAKKPEATATKTHGSD